MATRRARNGRGCRTFDVQEYVTMLITKVKFASKPNVRHQGIGYITYGVAIQWNTLQPLEMAVWMPISRQGIMLSKESRSHDIPLWGEGKAIMYTHICTDIYAKM